MTITSVGYGDIVPDSMNWAEQLICSAIMLISGMLWGYLIGTFCGLAAALSPSVQAFRADLSSLNVEQATSSELAAHLVPLFKSLCAAAADAQEGSDDPPDAGARAGQQWP